MSIPDIQILQNYILTMDCGHRRRTMAPCRVGQTLPCISEAHKMEQHVVASIEDVRWGRNVESIGWMSSQTALHGAHDELRAEANVIPWYQPFKKRRAERDARRVGLAAAYSGLYG